MKILMVLNMPWGKNLGGPRVQFELAEELQFQGHQIEMLDLNCVFPFMKFLKGRLRHMVTQLMPDFSVFARRILAGKARKFDVVDALAGCIPYAKAEFHFKGVLTSRSIGLQHFYAALAAKERIPQGGKQSFWNKLDLLREKQTLHRVEKCFSSADAIFVPNTAEVAFLREKGFQEKIHLVYFGLSREMHKQFENCLTEPLSRLKQKEVVFIGSWGTRKGSKDWAKIIPLVREKCPKTRFLFLATVFSAEKIFDEMKLKDSSGITIMPHYSNTDTPKLLAQSTLGAFPSYLEGFGFAVLEMASVFPVVAYDIPGPRDILSPLGSEFLVKPGDIQTFSDKICEILQMDESLYRDLCRKSRAVAQTFSWESIAQETLRIYAQGNKRGLSPG